MNFPCALSIGQYIFQKEGKVSTQSTKSARWRSVGGDFTIFKGLLKKEQSVDTMESQYILLESPYKGVSANINNG